MFRFRNIKPQYLHLYEQINNLMSSNIVTQKMIDHSELLLEIPTADQSTEGDRSPIKVLKVFNYEAIQ